MRKEKLKLMSLLVHQETGWQSGRFQKSYIPNKRAIKVGNLFSKGNFLKEKGSKKNKFLRLHWKHDQS